MQSIRRHMFKSPGNQLDHSIFHEELFAYDPNGRDSRRVGEGALPATGTSGLAQQNNTSQDAEDDYDDEQQAHPQEIEEETVAEELVRLTQPLFLDPDNAVIDGDIQVQISVEYLTERTPQSISFQISGTYNNIEEKGTILSGTVQDGIATATLTIPIHNEYYFTENKTENDKVAYNFRAWCSADDSEITSGPIELPNRVLNIQFIEVSDVNFYNNSAVPYLDGNGVLSAAVLKAYQYAREWPDKEVVFYGHTDESDSVDDLMVLSTRRAQAVKALLKNDTVAWNNAIEGYSSVADCQTMLNGLSVFYDWGCEVGTVSNEVDDVTVAAITEFQEEYNDTYEQSITIDGEMSPETWGALADTLFRLSLEHTDFQSDGLTVATNNEGVYGCGSVFSLDRSNSVGYNSTMGRRCEIGFHESPNPPALVVQELEDTLTEEECPAFDSVVCEKTIIEVELAPRTSGSVVVTFPATSNAHKHWVNFEKAGTNPEKDKELGEVVTIEVSTPGVKNNKKVYWKITRGATNSKRTHPMPAVQQVGGVDPVEFIPFDEPRTVSNEILTTSRVQDKKTALEIVCGKAGGDSYTVEIGHKKGEYTTNAKIVTWRRLQYDLQIPEIMAPSSVTVDGVTKKDLPSKVKKELVAMLDNLFVEYSVRDSLTYTNAELPAGSTMPPSFIKRDKVYSRDLFVLPVFPRRFNTANGFPATTIKPFNAIDDKTVQMNMCDALFRWDESYTTVTFTISSLDSDGAAVIKTKLRVLKNEIRNDLVSPGRKTILMNRRAPDGSELCQWHTEVNSSTHPKHPGKDMKGDLTGWSITHHDLWSVKIKPPSTLKKIIGTSSSTQCPVSVTFQVLAAINIGGATIGNYQMIGLSSDNTRAAVTIAHELGHSCGMTIMPQGNPVPPGLDAPLTVDEVDTNLEAGVYYRNPKNSAECAGMDGLRDGHFGPHCATGVASRDVDVTLNKKPGKCIMYGQLILTATTFCDTCKTYMKARNLSDIKTSWKGRGPDKS